ncbi:MAG: hypothetical protein EOP88_01245 [Verrucomicrobiaceae bacterium]|nr:MAG: hypothetical protein EOP88_01245 [Verrucomicrobiaceae bacterium]
MYTRCVGDGAKYKSALSPSHGTVAAMVLVAVWVVAATIIGGYGLGIRALLTFPFPLLFVWIPEIMARPGSDEAQRHFRSDGEILPNALRFAGWALILGTPDLTGLGCP